MRPSPNPFRRPVNVILCTLTLFVGFYVLVFVFFFQVHPLKDSNPDIPKQEPTSLLNIVEEIHTPSPRKVLRVNASHELDDLVTAVVECKTSHGDLVIDVRGHWGPLGAQRFLDLVELGMFTNLPFFRVCPRYITQFGVKYHWHSDLGNLIDDPSLWGKRDMNFGYLFFAVIELSFTIHSFNCLALGKWFSFSK
jgi:hypothetical protein